MSISLMEEFFHNVFIKSPEHALLNVNNSVNCISKAKERLIVKHVQVNF